MSGGQCPDCKGVLTAGLLYGPTEVPQPCTVCWECGWQTPAVYPRSRRERNDDGHAEVSARCRWCDGPITARRPSLLGTFCGQRCAAKHASNTRTAKRRAEMTRAAFLRKVS